jgi:hypothetical protein
MRSSATTSRPPPSLKKGSWRARATFVETPRAECALAAPIQSTTSSIVGRGRALRSSSVVGRHPKRRQVAATDVANDGT